MLNSRKKIHFIGIGGIGMSGIAWLCLKRGHRVSGSDIKPSYITDRLISEGADIAIGHSRENIRDNDVVVYSSAVSAANPELVEARKKGILVFKRGEFLAYLGDGKKCIAITGAHGKTTTSSMVATVLKEAGLEPSGMVGALVPYLNGNAFIGNGKYFVTEADESDGSFLYLRPDHGIITNIDLEHLDYYEGIEQIKEAYFKFMENVQPGGAVICWGEDPYIKRMVKHCKNRVLKYGKLPGDELCVRNIALKPMESEFDLIFAKTPIGRFKINVPGEHNVLNSMAAILTALDIGIGVDTVRRAIYQYRGAQRRFQEKACIDDIMIIDDYAHHPTEIVATLKTAANMKRRRIVSVFQPHRYTRTRFLKKEFAKAFHGTDCLILTDIYAADEKPIFGVTSMCIFNEVVKIKKVNSVYMEKEKLIGYLMDFIRPGDLLLFLGAGDIGRISGEFVTRLKHEREK
ncbi:MAG: UDP-N-acetylmuramate--L-alanine ligase [Candidatus Omnitrophica bacterium]|nr:UDP-N-acetylmuramate--L-alanine ligase [Candidatus Omnitrophota bacterium]